MLASAHISCHFQGLAQSTHRCKWRQMRFSWLQILVLFFFTPNSEEYGRIPTDPSDVFTLMVVTAHEAHSDRLWRLFIFFVVVCSYWYTTNSVSTAVDMIIITLWDLIYKRPICLLSLQRKANIIQGSSVCIHVVFRQQKKKTRAKREWGLW